MEIAICDDNLQCVEKILKLLQSFAKREMMDISVSTFTDGQSLLETQLEKYSLIFLDVDMGAISGIETAKVIRKVNKNVLLIYVSAYVEYATFGYEVNAFRYILKQSLEKSFDCCMRAAICQIGLQAEKITIKVDTKYIDLLLKDIRYFESNRRILQISVDGDQTIYRYYGKLDEVEKQLVGKGFLRIQKSFLINIDHTEKISGYIATMKNGEQINTTKDGYTDIGIQFAQWKCRI